MTSMGNEGKEVMTKETDGILSDSSQKFDKLEQKNELEQVIREEFAKLPDGEKMAMGIISRITTVFDAPPLGLVSLLVSPAQRVSGEAVSEEFFQRALVAPTAAHATLYVNAILACRLEVDTDEKEGTSESSSLETNSAAAPVGTLETLTTKRLATANSVEISGGVSWKVAKTSLHALRRLSSLLLTLFYLHHRKNWKFVEEWIFAGGFSALARLVASPNLIERSEALELFAALTDAETTGFDWFQDPRELASKTNSTVQRLYLELDRFSRPSECVAFLAALLKNRNGSYPGGYLCSLQILAFWLSWRRVHFTPTQRMALPPWMVEELQAWTTISDKSVVELEDNINSEDNTDENKPFNEFEEARKLAKTLLSDFTGARNLGEPDETGEVTTISHLAANTFDGECPFTAKFRTSIDEFVESIAREGSTIPSYANALWWKEHGNKAYRHEDLADAIRSYELAAKLVKEITSPDMLKSSSSMTISEEELKMSKALELTISTNLANALWKHRVHLMSNKDVQKGSEGDVLLQKIIDLTEAVLSSHPNSEKAAFRLVNALLEKGDIMRALQAINSFLDQTEGNGEFHGAFVRLRAKCLALQLVSTTDNSSTSGLAYSEWGLTPHKALLLRHILQRQQLASRITLPENSEKAPPSLKQKIHKIKGVQNHDVPTTSTLQRNLDLMTSELAVLDSLVEKSSPVEVSQSSVTTDKKKSSSKTTKKVKSTTWKKSEIREMSRELRQIANSISSSSIEFPVDAKNKALNVINKLWERSHSLCDLFTIAMEENELCLLFSIIISEDTSPAIAEHLIRDLSTYERLSSLTFIVRLSNPSLQTQLEASLRRVLLARGSEADVDLANSIRRVMAGFS